MWEYKVLDIEYPKRDVDEATALEYDLNELGAEEVLDVLAWRCYRHKCGSASNAVCLAPYRTDCHRAMGYDFQCRCSCHDHDGTSLSLDDLVMMEDDGWGDAEDE